MERTPLGIVERFTPFFLFLPLDSFLLFSARLSSKFVSLLTVGKNGSEEMLQLC